jgi:hypothetical protein
MKQTTDWFKNDGLFRRELEHGYQWQRYVVEQLRKNGIVARVPDLHFRTSVSDRHDWEETTDVTLENGKSLEVKSRRLKFTGPTDYPFPTVIVDTVSGYNAKRVKPQAYVLVSTITGNIIWMSGERIGWTIQEKYDATRKISDSFFLAPREALMPFCELVSVLKSGSQKMFTYECEDV